MVKNGFKLFGVLGQITSYGGGGVPPITTRRLPFMEAKLELDNELRC